MSIKVEDETTQQRQHKLCILMDWKGHGALQLCRLACLLGHRDCCPTHAVILSESNVVDLQHHMTCCTMQAAQDHLHRELATLYVSTNNVYILKVVTDFAQVCKLDVAASTQETLIVVCWDILIAD